MEFGGEGHTATTEAPAPVCEADALWKSRLALAVPMSFLASCSRSCLTVTGPDNEGTKYAPADNMRRLIDTATAALVGHGHVAHLGPATVEVVNQ